MTSVPENPAQDKPVELNIIRAPKNRAYIAVARKTAQDDRLSYEARGVLFYLLSKPDDWIIRSADIVNNSGRKANGEPNISKRKAESLLTELRNAGYLKTEYTRERGRFTSKVERLFDVSQDDITATSKNRRAVKPQSGKTVLRKSAHIHNTESLHNTDSLQPLASAKASAAPRSKPTPKPRVRNPLFDAVAMHLFGIPEGTPITNGARIGKAATLLKSHEVTAEDVPPFVAWYRRRYPDTSPPRDPAKLEEHVLAWRASQRQSAAREDRILGAAYDSEHNS